MVFRWGHSRSRASPFYLKIKTRGFHMKTPNVSELRPFKKREARDRESARARERDFSLTCALSLPRPRTLAFSSLAFFKTSKFQTCLRLTPYETPNCLKTGFKKRESRECECARARERDFSLALALSHFRASCFLKPVHFRHV